MRRSIRLRLAGLAVMCGFFALTASAQVKVGIINSQRAMSETAEIKKAFAALEAKYKPRQDEVNTLQRDIQEIQQKLRDGAGKLTGEAESDLQLQGQLKQRRLQRLGEDSQAELEQDQNDIINRARARMQAVVQKLAQERDLDLVVDISNTVYFKQALDITNDAIAAYDKAHPAQ
jgi:outer membrane protein